MRQWFLGEQSHWPGGERRRPGIAKLAGLDSETCFTIVIPTD